MSITRGNAATPLVGAVNGGALTFGSNPAAGQTVIVTIWSTATESITSVTDNGTTPATFTLDATQTSGGLNHTVWIYRANNITLPAAGAYKVTVTGSGGHAISGSAVAYSGVNTGAPTATNVSGTATSASVNTGTVTPAGAGALFVAGFGDNSAVNDSITLTGSGFAEQANAPNGLTYTPGASADKIDAGGPTATACTWTLAASHGWLSAIAVYDAGGGAIPHMAALLDFLLEDA